ncbi:MAG TPA: hypothetical protein DCZ84_02325 [Candidatus Vogelbacteria bacterium]|uniref:Vitamin K epoxide reductase domain-containing protein n=1 Tax=Candidatus Vogelbacteria bacterium RIFOXYD1_FULL_51_18 TaxID=1802440 RepID=A0A1G2QLP9_9BACT|nr:MAG: hypothetical protein UY66_C0034G0007 [Parcubacteria group bacterium GW2011_GWC1_51_35]KKW27660.1 MAG: hypothetical protein UY69_C0008G0023 [Parcubacteria group bacterium GW2011_GWF1_52_5]OHA60841.1 MAG: hypothetical protein A2569_02740 [Candidatus Vogelbacteria bacterium RIFOXYD1_FULL_51_18]HBB65447.1 hypothetical protein [Candidatus Vogelbacteria bacterium]HBC44122.1 hypothetical protein [Candidatus Vogelbacteria bacterium]
MKSALSVLLIASLIGIAALGALSVHAGMQDHDGNCAIALAQGTDCPRQANPLDYASFHIGAFKNFSLATVGALFALLAAVVAGVAVRVNRDLSTLLHPRVAYARYLKDSVVYVPQCGFIHWLALHENSPASLPRAAM